MDLLSSDGQSDRGDDGCPAGRGVLGGVLSREAESSSPSAAAPARRPPSLRFFPRLRSLPRRMEPFSVGTKTDGRIAEDNSSVHHEGGEGRVRACGQLRHVSLYHGVGRESTPLEQI